MNTNPEPTAQASPPQPGGIPGAWKKDLIEACAAVGVCALLTFALSFATVAPSIVGVR